MRRFKLWPWALVLALCIGVLTSCQAKNGASDKPKQEQGQSTKQDDKKLIYTSFYPLQYMTERIVKDKMTVENIMKMGEEVHGWEPSAQDMAKLNHASLLIINGLQLEGWLDHIQDNAKITICDTSAGVDTIKIGADGHDEHDHAHDHDKKDAAKTENKDDHDHDHDHEHEHHHGEFDPHIWLSPKSAMIQAENIYKAVSKLDPENEGFYKSNFDALKKDLSQLDDEYTKGMEGKTGYVIVPHEAFGYLARDYHFNQVPIEGIHSDSEPDLAKMKELTEFAKDHKITTVFYEEEGNPRISEEIAKTVGAKAEGISTIESRTQKQIDSKEDYLSLMRQNMEKIIKAVQ